MPIDKRILDLLANLEFHEHESKPGLYLKELDEIDACGRAGVTAYIDFRRTNRGWRFYTVEGIEGPFNEEDDIDTIPVLQYFKQQRDDILTGTKQQPIIQDGHDNPTSASSQLPEVIKKKPPTGAKSPIVAPVSYLMVEPVATIERQIEVFNLYESAKSKLLSDNDVLWIGEDGKPAQKGKGKPHIKRSGWRKLARFFGLSCHILSKEKIIEVPTAKEQIEGKRPEYKWIYHVTVRHPSGAYQEAEGICSSKDKFFTKGGKVEAKEENVMLKAQTVAFNRAISDLLGGGEVSAEEIE